MTLMSDSYKVNVNDSFHFDLEKEQVSRLDAVTVENNNFHVLHENKPYKAAILSADFNQKKYTVKVNNNSYTVAISDDLDLLIKEMGFEVGATKQVNAIKAPMPGLILEISVVAGQSVKENDPVLILEAMKMENSFLSPRDGVIKSIAVSKGDAVDKGQLLIEFE
jgi:biotin carboxyl carrier protein